MLSEEIVNMAMLCAWKEREQDVNFAFAFAFCLSQTRVGLKRIPYRIQMALRRIQKELESILKNKKINCGELDITFYRDDFRKKELIPNRTNIDFIIEDKNVVLVDDVLFTGRTIRAGLDAMLAFGRPKDVELLVLVDRRLSRHVPIQAKYIGMTIDSITTQNVKVEWKEIDGKDKITLKDK
jgi:pyrimidine operon attenuation protein/uracil phosphoribosyltransferase